MSQVGLSEQIKSSSNGAIPKKVIDAPFVQIPLGVTEDRLVGTVDIEASMKVCAALNIAWGCTGHQGSACPVCQSSQYALLSILSGTSMTVLCCVSMQLMITYISANTVSCLSITKDAQISDHACTHCMYCAAHIPHQFAVCLLFQTCTMPSGQRCFCSLCSFAHLDPCRRAKQYFSQGSWPKPTGAFCM